MYLLANVAKQKKLASNLLLYSIKLVCVDRGAMGGESILSSSIKMAFNGEYVTDVGLVSVSPTRGMLRHVLRMPLQGCRMCPLAVAGLGLRYFKTPFTVRLGHPLRYPHRMAFMRVDTCRLHRDWCAKRCPKQRA